RETAAALPVVMVGRDIGTIVLPDADLKIFLTTSLDERAMRRHADLVAAHGLNAPTIEEVREEIAARDAGDANQLQVAQDAIVINNDHLQPPETVARILALAQQRIRERTASAAVEQAGRATGGAG